MPAGESVNETLEEPCEAILGTDGTRSPSCDMGGVWRSLSSRENLVTILPDSRNFESAADLSQRLGLHFSNLALLTRALTHRSYVNENPDSVEDNERLEFLGMLCWISLLARGSMIASRKCARAN